MTQAARSRVFVDGNNVMARDRTAGGVTEPEPLEGSLPRSFRWPSATVAYGRLCSMGRSRPACRRHPSGSSWFTLAMAAGMEADDRIVELVHECSDGAASLVYTSDAKLRTRVKALGTQVMGSGTLLSQIATLRTTVEPTDVGHSPDSADGSGSDTTKTKNYRPSAPPKPGLARIRDERGREKAWGFLRFFTLVNTYAIPRGD